MCIDRISGLRRIGSGDSEWAVDETPVGRERQWIDQQRTNGLWMNFGR
jgi:hypothetical protein